MEDGIAQLGIDILGYPAAFEVLEPPNGHCWDHVLGEGVKKDGLNPLSSYIDALAD